MDGRVWKWNEHAVSWVGGKFEVKKCRERERERSIFYSSGKARNALLMECHEYHPVKIFPKPKYPINEGHPIDISSQRTRTNAASFLVGEQNK